MADLEKQLQKCNPDSVKLIKLSLHPKTEYYQSNCSFSTLQVQVADGSSLQLLFNPASDQLSLKAPSEYIERKRMLATRLNVITGRERKYILISHWM